MSFPVVADSFEQIERLLADGHRHVFVRGHHRAARMLVVPPGTRLSGLPGNELACCGIVVEKNTLLEDLHVVAYSGGPVSFPAGQFRVINSAPGFWLLQRDPVPEPRSVSDSDDESGGLTSLSSNVIPLHRKDGS